MQKIWIALLMAWIDPLTGAASFLNLDFEQYHPTTSLNVPGWTFENARIYCSDGSHTTTSLRFTNSISDLFASNPFSTPPAAAMLSSAGFGSFVNPGNYVVALVPLGDLEPWYMRQSGEIPADAQSLSFDLWGNQVSVRIDGNPLPLVFEGRGGFYGRDYADISAFSGKTARLEIEATGTAPLPIVIGISVLDNFQFSHDPVPVIPEPSPLVIIVAFGSFLVLRHYRMRTP